MRATYIITECYDGHHVRIIASANSPAVAERQLRRERAARERQGYGFFRPLRRILAQRKDVENELDSRLAGYATWHLAVDAADGRETRGRCAICGRDLTDPESIAAGIGPVCAGRMS